MDRRNFLSLAAGAAASTALPAPLSAAAKHGAPITPMLYGLPRKSTDLPAWFGAMKKWGVRQWMSFGVPLPTYWHDDGPVSNSCAFLEDAWPGFRPYLDSAALAAQEARLREAESLCASHNIEFWYMLPFPIFPSLDITVIKNVVPDMFRSGSLNLFDPRMPDLLKATVRSLKQALPTLRGVNFWLSEGSGSASDVIGKVLEQNRRWEEPLLQAFDEVTAELDMRGILFCHHYLQTVRTHRNVYQMMQNFPRLVLMDDITWPEEDMLHPFLGYLPPQDRTLLFRKNPVALNFLLDTEYIGEGVLPSAYPRWFQHNVRESVRSGVSIAMGRTFFWDDGRTDVNFNRLNAQMFTRFCHQPELDARQALEEAAREMFGSGINDRLIEILWQTEPVVRGVIGINGVDSFNHSRFPSPEYIDVLYTERSNCMKAVDDLFSPPGTRLYPPLSDDLNNYKQWRWQDHTVSRSAESYLAIKRAAITWLQSVLPEVRQHAAALAPQHAAMFVNGYELLLVLAQGMEIFVETATLHYQWAHAKSIDDGKARPQFLQLAQRLRAVAATVSQNPFGYQQQMIYFAVFLETKIPRISRN